MYEGHSKSFASRYATLKKLFKIYASIKRMFLLNTYEPKAYMTSW